jgi:protein-tyrosine-phosphatase
MAEGFAKNYKISSGGIFPEPVNPYAIKVMKQIDIDISDHK